ncbi:MAG: HEAT repeat domain-containing protein [Chloroflexi bacterium]|nr:HEAT repeat domain-containing protein [Chloroflexota bacterium]
MDLDINQPIDYQTCSPDQLVSLLGFKAHYINALRTLVGGAFGREFPQLVLTDTVFQALVRGLEHKNPNVRFQCVQLMDHLGDDRIIEPVRQMLHDWAPRVRKQALHALTCEQCKSVPLCPLPGPVVEDFIDLAMHDPNLNVRIAAVGALGVLPASPQVSQSLQAILTTTTEPKLRQAVQLTLSAGLKQARRS